MSILTASAEPSTDKPLTMPASEERVRNAAIADTYLDLRRKTAEGLPPAEAEAEMAAAAREHGWDVNAITWATGRSYNDVRRWAARVGLSDS